MGNITNKQKAEYFDKLIDTLDNHRPWEWKGSIWKTQAEYFTWIRSQFRSIWSDWPIKNNYLRSHSIDIPKLDDKGKQIYYKTGNKKGKPVTVKGYKCEVTGKILKASKPKGQRGANYNIDHVDPAGSLTNSYEACIYLFRLLCSDDNMQLLDTEYHKILTHSESKGISIEDARSDKEAIKIMKGDEKKWLTKKGLTPATNAKLRREQVFEYLKENRNP